MIEQIKGRLLSKEPTFAVVDVHGVGYGVSISIATYEQLAVAGEEVLLVTHLYVREDRLELFGFASARERTMFRLLLGVSGIGPHSAQAVLSGISLGDLEAAICQGRAHELTAIKGIGRKTAERIVLDLRDKVRPGTREQATSGAAGAAETGTTAEAEKALVALGIAPTVARQALSRIQKSTDGDLSVQDMIKLALRER